MKDDKNFEALKARFGVETPDELVAFGDTAKAEGDLTFSGYLVRFGSPKDLDLEGDYFHSKTNYGTAAKVPLFYQHGYDGTLKATQIGVGTLKFDEVGLWLEGQLALRAEYEKDISGEDADKYFPPIMKMIKAGKLALSSGAVSHLARGKMMGNAWQWDQWLIGEASLTPTPAEPRNGVKTLQEIKDLPSFKALSTKASPEDGKIDVNVNIKVDTSPAKTDEKMAPEIKKEEEPKADPVVDLLKAIDKKIDANTARLDAADTKAADELAAGDAAKKGVTGPGTEPKVALNAPAIFTQGMGHLKSCYDMKVVDMLWMLNTLGVAKKSNFIRDGKDPERASTDAYKSLIMRLDSDTQIKGHRDARAAAKAMVARGALKADELEHTTNTGFGLEWIGTAYDSSIWEEVRAGTVAMNLIPNFTFPTGVSTLVIPIDAARPTWFGVAEAISQITNTLGKVAPTVTSSQVATDNVTATLKKIGCRVIYSGEFTEDAIVPWVSILRKQMTDTGAETMDYMIMDGDSETSDSTNINFIDTTPASTEAVLKFNGFRKSALITTPTNSRAVGTLTTDDYLQTAKLLGVNGRVGRDKRANVFLIDGSTHDKTLTLADVRSKDVFTGATIESGELTKIWNYRVILAENLCFGGSGLANSAGKIDDDTASNNTTGTMVCVRTDKWLFGWRRRMTTELTRQPNADATEIVSLMRASLTQRDTEASAVGFNIQI